MTIAKLIVTALRILVGELIETGPILAGAALIAYGCWLAWAPAGFIVGGALLIAGAILRARGNG